MSFLDRMVRLYEKVHSAGFEAATLYDGLGLSKGAIQARLIEDVETIRMETINVTGGERIIALRAADYGRVEDRDRIELNGTIYELLGRIPFSNAHEYRIRAKEWYDS